MDFIASGDQRRFDRPDWSLTQTKILNWGPDWSRGGSWEDASLCGGEGTSDTVCRRVRLQLVGHSRKGFWTPRCMQMPDPQWHYAFSDSNIPTLQTQGSRFSSCFESKQIIHILPRDKTAKLLVKQTKNKPLLFRCCRLESPSHCIFVKVFPFLILNTSSNATRLSPRAANLSVCELAGWKGGHGTGEFKETTSNMYDPSFNSAESIVSPTESVVSVLALVI